VLVTVGSTKFEALLEVVDSQPFVEIIAGRGYNALFVQYGAHAAGPPVHLPALAEQHGLAYHAFDMSPTFSSVLAQAALVISHAGPSPAAGALTVSRLLTACNARLRNDSGGPLYGEKDGRCGE